MEEGCSCTAALVGKDLKQDVPFHVIYRLMTLRTPHV